MPTSLSRIDLWSYAGSVVSTLALVFLLIFAAVKLRRWYGESDNGSCDWQTSLTEYRDLENQGLITSEEFQRIKRQIIAKSPDLNTRPNLNEPLNLNKPKNDIPQEGDYPLTSNESADSSDQSPQVDQEKSPEA